MNTRTYASPSIPLSTAGFKVAAVKYADGMSLPFKIKETYDILREDRTESRVDFVIGC
jgi:hypothetical protein